MNHSKTTCRTFAFLLFPKIWSQIMHDLSDGQCIPRTSEFQDHLKRLQMVGVQLAKQGREKHWLEREHFVGICSAHPRFLAFPCAKASIIKIVLHLLAA
jgi:hypothetical protein